MRRAVLIGAAASVMLAASAAHAWAGSCGGGGGGSGGGGGGGGGGGYSSSSDSSSSSSSTPSCVDASDVVGHRTCKPYGTWGANLALPMVVIELGTSVASFANPVGTQDRRINHEGHDFTYRVVEPAAAAAAPTTTMVATMRVAVGGGPGLYGAIEGELGGVTSAAPRAEMVSAGMLGTPTIEQTSALAYGALGVVGVRGGLGGFSLGAELVGGVRGVSYRYHSQYLACAQTDVIYANRGILEARVRAATWLSPVWSLGVQAGSSLVERGAWMTGIYVGAHSRMFGGGR